MKNALIIGATSGIGKELAKLLSADYDKVVITGRRENLLQEIKATNPEKFVVKVQDVTDLNSCETLFSDLQNELKTIDLIVYSSGVGDPNYELAWEK
ncbi:MAG: SDR family NAD(P)-dependent oxidoreductase, partial [Lutibacter sp.]|nr:SDR family NAD(P)-dependent oxidoreductase [Lutibacter sp.]